MKKIIFWFVFVIFLGLWLKVQAQDYILFYGNGCPHCQKVEKFFEENKIAEKFWTVSKEIYFNKNNLKELQWYLKKLNLDSNQIWIPFLVINQKDECTYINWDWPIIEFFDKKLDQSCSTSWCNETSCKCTNEPCNEQNCQWLKCESTTLTNTWNQWSFSTTADRWRFFGVMLPAALSDSINPCEFAVMLLLISSILTKTKSRRKALLSWWLFVLAVFLSYFGMWIGLFTALAWAQNTYLIKLIVWILGILVWLANLKDFFRYGKWFVMEVPFGWRPKMASLIEKIASPGGAFVVWVIVSLFLLPCTSWPYFTILWYLASESKNLNLWWYIYLLIYNIIFVLPMIVIAVLVWFGFKSAEELAKIKKKNTKLIHLIVWLLMLGLWIYVLFNL